MLERIGLRHGVLVGLAVLGVCAWLAPDHVVGGDNAELATLGRTGGVAHPSGYPLYVLWLRATSWLPGSPAHAAALATALLAAASAVLLLHACRAWGAGVAASGVAVALVAGSPVVLLLSSQAEVFALNGVIAASILWLAADGGPVRGERRVALLGLCAGLGMANHLSCVMLAPLGIYGVVIGMREATRRGVAAAAGAGALVAGLSPYLYLFVAPDGGLSWGEIDSVGALVRHVLRVDYGTFDLGVTEQSVTAGESAGALLAAIGRAWLWLPLVAAVAAIGLGVRGAARASWLAFLLAWLAAGPLLLARFNLAPSGLAAHVVERFYHLPTLLLAVPVAVGFEHGLAALGRRRPTRAPLPAAVIAGLTLAVFAAGVGLSLDRVARSTSPAVERYLANTLAALPPDAVLVGTGDHHLFGFAYLQYARGMRPDVVYVDWKLTYYPWYRARLDARLGGAAIPDGPGLASVRLAQGVLARGRPLFVDSGAQANILAAFRSYPVGTVIRVVGRDTPMQALDAILAENEAVFARYDLRYPRPHAGDGWAAAVHRRYAETWTTLAAALTRAHRDADAERAQSIAAQLAPLP